MMSGKAFSYELLSARPQKPALVMAVSIKRGEEIIGVLGAAMNIDTLSIRSPPGKMEVLALLSLWMDQTR